MSSDSVLARGCFRGQCSKPLLRTASIQISFATISRLEFNRACHRPENILTPEPSMLITEQGLIDVKGSISCAGVVRIYGPELCGVPTLWPRATQAGPGWAVRLSHAAVPSLCGTVKFDGITSEMEAVSVGQPTKPLQTNTTAVLDEMQHLPGCNRTLRDDVSHGVFNVCEGNGYPTDPQPE